MLQHLGVSFQPGGYLVAMLLRGGTAPVQNHKPLSLMTATPTEVQFLTVNGLGEELIEKSIQILFAEILRETKSNIKTHFLKLTLTQFLAKALFHFTPPWCRICRTVNILLTE